MIFILSLLFLGIAMLFGFKLMERLQETGEVYARVTYREEIVLMIDLETLEYKVYDTQYKDQIIVARASEGIFYVPGSSTTKMDELYLEDEFAQTNQIVGVKLLVEAGKIQVEYQESPKNICELQRPTSSSLEPLVCLPNELVVSILTNKQPDEFIPDAILE